MVVFDPATQDSLELFSESTHTKHSFKYFIESRKINSTLNMYGTEIKERNEVLFSLPQTLLSIFLRKVMFLVITVCL